jgi:hypothetical protein
VVTIAHLTQGSGELKIETKNKQMISKLEKKTNKERKQITKIYQT